MKYRLLFLGSNWESVSTLEALRLDDRFEIVGVITQPDKPSGRKGKIQPTEVKKWCESVDIPVYHTVRDDSRYREALELFQPDIVVCKSFGEIIPDFFLETPKYGAINIHYSLLPKYRGAIPIQKAIIDGLDTTGITYVKMVEALDAGGILEMYEERVRPDDTNLSLRERLVEITGQTVGVTLQRWIDGEIDLTPQDESQATYCWKREISKEEAQINWTEDDALSVDRRIRGYIPWPVAWFMHEGKRVKVFEARILEVPINIPTGKLRIFDEKLVVKTADESIVELVEVQIEGKTKESGYDLARRLRLESHSLSA